MWNHLLDDIVLPVIEARTHTFTTFALVFEPTDCFKRFSGYTNIHYYYHRQSKDR